MNTDIVLFRPISELAAMRQHLGDLRNSKLLVAGVDYSIIPGTNNSKPTLMKPGAEKLLQAYNLSCQLDITERFMDWEAGLFYFSYRATVLDTSGRILAAAEGSANSRETKYRYRNVNENKATEADKRDAVRSEVKEGKYGRYTVYVIENRDPADLINTLQKMAQKRAMVAAVLIAVGASEFFTQDVEDFSHIIDGEVIEEQTQRQPRPAQRQQPAPAPIDNTPSIPTKAAEMLPYAIRLFGDEGMAALKTAAEARGVSSLKTASPQDLRLVVEELNLMLDAAPSDEFVAG